MWDRRGMITSVVMRRSVLTLIVGLLSVLAASSATAQTQAEPPKPPAPAAKATAPVQAVATPTKPAAQKSAQAIPGLDSEQWHIERLGPDYWRLTGDVEIDLDGNRFFADTIEVHTDTDQAVAKGNVVLSTPTQRISADRAEFNLKTKLGTFYNASGSATLGDPKEKSQFGTQEPEVLFYGKTMEKIGERKYRITDGGFTTCVQPRPRWEMTSGTVILSVDHYAMLTNPILKVKGLPVFYMPIIYYPINKEDRATGFLIPVYGKSALRGHTVSNAFFWAINRSQDLTLNHDWFSRTGRGYGGEYNYIRSNTSRGAAKVYLLRERASELVASDGTTTPVAGRKGLEIRSNVSQDLPFKLKGRARVDYFSEIQVQQTYYQNIYDASRRTRYYGGNVSGTWGTYTLNASAERSEMFFDSTSSTATGNKPRLTFARAERPVKKTPIYAAFNAEYVNMSRSTTYGDSTTDLSMHRFDMTPAVRVPFRKWPFLTVNTALSYRFTWWNQSKDPTGTMIKESVNRSYFDLQSRIVGPVFNRIWNTDNGYAEKIKHTIEPSVTIQRVTNFDTYDRIVQLDGTDYVVGGTTRVVYALTNRVYAKKKEANRQGRAREIFNVVVRQTYYTDERASIVDGSYASGFNFNTPSKFSPISIQARAVPFESLSATVRAEYDTRIDALKTLGLVGSWSIRDWFTTQGSWSKQRYFSAIDPKTITLENQYVTSQSTLRFMNNRFGGDVSFHYDISKKYFLQRRFLAYYNAQCCGIAVDYQIYDFSGYGSSYRLPVERDTRFNISITLSGVGTFSNPLGALGGSQGTVR